MDFSKFAVVKKLQA